MIIATVINHVDLDGNIVQEQLTVTWEQVRVFRDAELVRTDFWALKDLTMSQAKKDYRIFLRDLPQNYESANEAADAWNEYDIPE
tara:strand:+ start:252 stop:506 length:255 start_codon:yes stop_codon:yes gene_type:complete